MAQFRIDQAVNGTPGESRHDLEAGSVITLVATDPAPGAGVSYAWEIIDKVGSPAVLQAVTGQSVDIGPAGDINQPCGFKVRLTADNNGTVTTVDRIASVRGGSSGLRYSLFGEAAPLSQTLDANDPDESTDNATYADLAGLGVVTQNWRSYAEQSKEVVDAIEQLASTDGPKIRYDLPFQVDVTGTTWENVGHLYLPEGTLEAPARVFMGATTVAPDGAEVELRRESNGDLIASWAVTGLLAEATLGASAAIPASEWYFLRLRGDAVGIVGLLRGINWIITV